MTDIFFYIFSAIALASAFAVVLSSSTVNAAMSLIVTFLSMAALFVLLESYFLAVVQVLVYAGAVVVLFLFVIMLLDERETAKRKAGVLSTIAAFVGFGILCVGIVAIRASESLTAGSDAVTSVSLKGFGQQLFTTYLLPMQVTGFLLLISMVGVIVISKKAKTTES